MASLRSVFHGHADRDEAATITVTVHSVPPPAHPVPALDHWIAESIGPDAAVLNIGAGANLSGELRRVRNLAGRVVGVDPSDRVLANPGIDEAHHGTLEAFAPAHTNEFDVAFSVFVLEHVADPRAFSEACAQVLKPGGVLFGLTVNMWHYFGLATCTLTRAGMADWLLPRLRPAAHVAGYHFPTEYRLNTTRSIARRLGAAGFSSVEFRMWDRPEMYLPYLPGPLARVADPWQAMTYRRDWPNAMGNLTFRAVR